MIARNHLTAAEMRSCVSARSPPSAYPPCKALRFADAEQFSQNPSQVVRGDRNQITFRHVDHAFEPTASHSAAVADVREGPFDTLAPQPAKSFAFGPLHPPSVLVHGPLEFRRLVGPCSLMLELRLGNVGPQAQGVALFDRLGRVVALVGRRFFDLGFELPRPAGSPGPSSTLSHNVAVSAASPG